MTLTEKQRRVLWHVRSFHRKHGWTPTTRELADRVGVSSPATIHHYLDALERKGMIRRLAHAARAMEITEEGHKMLDGVEVVSCES